MNSKQLACGCKLAALKTLNSSTYRKGDKEKTFVGVLAKGYMVKMKDGSDHEVKMSELMGMRVKAYYMTKSKKVNDQKVKTNEVFKLRFLPPDK